MRLLKLFPLVSIFLSLSSCAPYIYTPKPQCAPFFGNRGEALASAETGTSSANFQGAYAATNHVFIAGNTSFSLPDNASNINFFRMLEFSGGYYTMLDSTNNTFRFEIQGGYGFGYRSGSGSVPSDWFFFIPLGSNYYAMNTHYNYTFVQPAISWLNKNFELGFSCRFTYMEFPGFYYELIASGHNGLSSIEVMNQWGPEYFLQPALYWAIGGKHIKFISQFGLSLPLLTSGVIYNNPAYFDFYSTFGFQVRLFNDYDY